MRVDLPDPQAFARILQAVTGCSPEILPTGVATDSRECLAGDLYIAIPGERVDGNDFLPQVKNRHASAALVNRLNDDIPDLTQFKVDDPVKVLGEIAAKWRNRFNIPIIGVTGSNGKTTTKDLLTHILSGSRIVHNTRGNYNTSVGLPLTLLTMTEVHDVSVLEMGANQPGDIELLASLARPTHGIITNIAPAHLEGFGSIEKVAQTKGELFAALESGISFVNLDDPFISVLPVYGDQISFGFQPDCDYSADLLPQENGTILLVINAGEMNTASKNSTFSKNILAATAIADSLGESWETIQEQIYTFELPDGRCVVKPLGSITVIDDTYNANLSSVSAAIDFLSDYKTAGRHVLVFGDMFELGENSSKLHTQVGEKASQARLDAVFTVGEDSEYTDSALKNIDYHRHFKSKADLREDLQKYLQPDDVVLFKGSRGMAMESIISELVEI